MIRMARENVPAARFIHGDVTAVDFAARDFDAIVSFYAIFHIPREEHRALFSRFSQWLKPGGLLLVTLAESDDGPGYTESDFFGVTMYWSYYGPDVYRDMLQQTGFEIAAEGVVGHGYGGVEAPEERHPFFLARRRSEGGADWWSRPWLMGLPEAVARAVERYLDLADRRLPAWIGDMYLVGSLALDDYRDGHSDLDCVCVCAPSPAMLVQLRELHRELERAFAKPDLDAIYILREQLLHPPTETGVASYQGGRLREGDAFNANHVTWNLLNTCPLAVRGDPRPRVHDDTAQLKAWCKQNVAGYWRSWTDGARAKLARPREADEVDVVWGVLGVTRLHATIATGQVISKSTAANYARLTFGRRWHELLDRVLAAREHRHAEEAEFDMAHKELALEYMEHVINSQD